MDIAEAQWQRDEDDYERSPQGQIERHVEMHGEEYDDGDLAKEAAKEPDGSEGYEPLWPPDPPDNEMFTPDAPEAHLEDAPF